MRRTLVLVLALLLSGCAQVLSGDDADRPSPPAPTQPTSGEPAEERPWTPTSKTRAGADDLWPRATALAREWRDDARPVYVASSTQPRAVPVADTASSSPPPERPAPEEPVDGTVKQWAFAFMADEGRAFMFVNLAANGTVLSRQDGWERERPSHMAEFRPLDPAWLDTGRLVRALTENATTRPFTQGAAYHVSYGLGPRDASASAWGVSVEGSQRTLSAEVDPVTWRVTRAETYPTYYYPPDPPNPRDWCQENPNAPECGGAPPPARTYKFNASVTYLEPAHFEFPVKGENGWWRLKVIAWVNWTGLPVDELEAALLDEDDNPLRSAYGPSPLRVLARWGEPGTWKVDVRQVRPQQPMDVQVTIRVSYESHDAGRA